MVISDSQMSAASEDVTDRILLSESTIKALDLLPSSSSLAQNGPSRGNKTLLEVLNHCKTADGRNELKDLIKRPLKDYNQICERQELVGFFVGNAELRAKIANCLRSAPDLSNIERKMMTKRATLRQMVSLYAFIQKLPAAGDAMVARGNIIPAVEARLIRPLAAVLGDFHNFLRLVEDAIDMENMTAASILIKPDYDEELDQLKEEMLNLEQEAAKEHRHSARKLGGIEPKLEIDPDEKGFLFKLTLKDEKHYRKVSQSNAFKTISNAKNDGIRFTSDTLEQLSIRYLDKHKEYTERQKIVEDEVLQIAFDYHKKVNELNNVIVLFDVSISLAEAATASPTPYVRPIILSDEEEPRRIIMTKIRHPCLELQAEVNFIPNDVAMSEQGKKFYVLTGPNMGGKSTYIRSVAVNVIMAHIGSYVPAETAEISIVDGIFTRIGAGDNVLKGVSTFMEEMQDSAQILDAATDRSLVIIDELGRGTSTHDGYGIALAISEELAIQKRSFCIFATHFHELTHLEKDVPCVGNLHVETSFEGGQLTMMYEVQPGPCNASFGINVAQMVQFPESVIREAQQREAEVEPIFSNAEWEELCSFVRGDGDPEQPCSDEMLMKYLFDKFGDRYPGSGPEST